MEETKQDWLVWSNEHKAWWGPNNSGYYTDWRSAGRYTLAQALDNCAARNGGLFSDKRPTQRPDEVLVPAPEYIDFLQGNIPRAAIAAAESK